MNNILERCGHLPAVHFAAGQAVVREGAAAQGLWILASGALEVQKGNVLINIVQRPGALIGEVAVLLNSTYGATVTATAPSVLHHAVDGLAFIQSDPEIGRLLAVGLAERLNFVTTYLADLKHQYGDAPGLAMVSEVLNQLADSSQQPARPGSARDPNPDY